MSAGRDRHPLFTGGALPVDFKIGYPRNAGRLAPGAGEAGVVEVASRKTPVDKTPLDKASVDKPTSEMPAIGKQIQEVGDEAQLDKGLDSVSAGAPATTPPPAPAAGAP